MPWSFIIPAAASLIGGEMQSRAASSASDAANAQAERDLALRTRMYDEGIARQKPYADIGLEFTNKLAAMQRGGPGAANEMMQMDPGYGFRLSEGTKALERSAAARGGLISGGTGGALQRYGQGLASQEYQNAYNRMAGLAGLGPSAAGVQNSLGQQYAAGAGGAYETMGQNTGNALLSAAQARASSYGDVGRLYGRAAGQPSMGGGAFTPDSNAYAFGSNWWE